MTMFFYGCDILYVGDNTSVPTAHLKLQRERIIGYLKEHGLPDFDTSRWYSDIGRAIMTPWVTRPGAIQLLIRARKGDIILADRPERVVTKIAGCGKGGGGQGTFNSLAEVGIAIHTTMPEFPVVAPVDANTWKLIGARYSAMLAQAKYGKTNEAFNVAFPMRQPIGWKVVKGRGLKPDRSERIIATNIYNCAINNILPVRWVAKAFRIEMADVVKSMIAVENGFDFAPRIRYKPVAVAPTGPSVPNVRNLLLCMCGPPLSLRELAVRSGIPAIQLHYLFRNMIAANRFMQSRGKTTFPVAKMLQPKIMEDRQFVQVAKVTLTQEAQTMILADSPLIDYEPIADSFNGISSSGRIFHELDGVGPPLPCRLSSPSRPRKDRSGTRAAPSRQPDQEPDQPDEEEPESPEL